MKQVYNLILAAACCLMTTGTAASPNDRTAKWVNIEQVKDGTGAGLTQAYTGKGVILGIVDIGFDLTHPTFYAADGKTYRIKRFVENGKTDDTNGHVIPLGREYRTEEEILGVQHSADYRTSQHATHVLGIAAGSGYGTPYQGMAPETEICAVAIDRETDYMKDFESPEFKYIFDYADEQGKPCVINYSAGTGFDPVNFYKAEQAMKKMLGPGHILVAGAGNSGSQPFYTAKKRGIEAGGVFLKYSDNKPERKYHFISNDPFTIKCIRVTSPNMKDYTKGDSLTFDSQNLPTAKQTIDIYQAQITKLDSIYTLTLSFTDPEDMDITGSFMLVAEGKDAQVKIISDPHVFFLDNTALDPRCNLAKEARSILVPACWADVIAVGNIIGRLGAKDSTADIPADTQGLLGTRDGTSSIGPAFTGIAKPDVVAPGSSVISAGSSFSSRGADNIIDFTETEFNGKTYPWRVGLGTSMSSPVVAGIIALWLEAKPTLTPQEALETIRLTSKPLGVDSLGHPNGEYGYGLIDAYKGLLHVLGIDTSIRSLSQHQPAGMTFRVAGDLLYADGAEDGIPVTFYNLSGTLVRQSQVENGTVSLSGMPKGVYAVQLGKLGSTLIRK